MRVCALWKGGVSLGESHRCCLILNDTMASRACKCASFLVMMCWMCGIIRGVSQQPHCSHPASTHPAPLLFFLSFFCSFFHFFLVCSFFRTLFLMFIFLFLSYFSFFLVLSFFSFFVHSFIHCSFVLMLFFHSFPSFIRFFILFMFILSFLCAVLFSFVKGALRKY